MRFMYSPMFFAFGIARYFASHPAFCAASGTIPRTATNASAYGAIILFIAFFRSLLFRLPDVPHPRHRLTQAVDELVCLEVFDATEHDDLCVDTTLLELRDPLLGRTN